MIGACPSCERPGEVGHGCPERVCKRNGIHVIPEDNAREELSLPAERREPLVGTVIGDFLVVGKLGVGGFGKVLLVLQRPLFKLKAALKLLNVEALRGSDLRSNLQKFENEAGALAVLNHPNIVRLLYYGTMRESPYLVMEYVPGSRTLLREIQEMAVAGRRIDLPIVKQLVTQMISGLEAAHAEQIIHRDIKPENVMLQRLAGDPYFVRLVDFGLAKFVAEGDQTSRAIGTPMYMAPEQLTREEIGPWTDLYAVGVITFELLTGRRPFSGATAEEVVRQKLDPTYDVNKALAGLELPETVVTFLRKALAWLPQNRYRSASTFRAAFQAALDSATTTLVLSRDLSRLVDTEELQRLRREREQIDSERKAIEAERERLERERRVFEAEQRRATPSGVRARAMDGVARRGPPSAAISVETTGVIRTGPSRAVIAAAVIVVVGGGVGVAAYLKRGGAPGGTPADTSSAAAEPKREPKDEPKPKSSSRTSPNEPDAGSRIVTASAPDAGSSMAAVDAGAAADAGPVVVAARDAGVLVSTDVGAAVVKSAVADAGAPLDANPVTAKPDVGAPDAGVPALGIDAGTPTATSTLVSFKVTTVPAGAAIVLGKLTLGFTPTTVSAPPGASLVIRLPGYAPQKLVVKASPGGTQEASLTLKKPTAATQPGTAPAIPKF